MSTLVVLAALHAFAGGNAPDVSGKYYFGDGLGVNCSLVVSPEGTFAFRWRGCLGEYDRNGGKCSWEGNVFVLHPEKPNARRGLQGTATRFIPVRWADRMYLVAEEQILGFC